MRGRGVGDDWQDNKSRQQKVGGGIAIYFAGALLSSK